MQLANPCPNPNSIRTPYTSQDAMSRQPPQNGSMSHARSSSSNPDSETASKRASGSEFICKLKYQNTLPPVPIDAKLLTLPLAPSRYIKYRATSLESESMREIPFHPKDLLSLDLIDWTRYQTYSDRGTAINPADQKLATAVVDSYRPPEKSKAAKKGPEAQPKPAVEQPAIVHGQPSQPNRPTVTWLRKSGLSAKRDRPSENIGTKLEPSVKPMTLTKTKEIIEKSFQGAADLTDGYDTFTHPKNPNLRVKRILPVYPDGCCWGRKLALLSFDTAPTDGESRPTDCLIMVDASNPQDRKMHHYGPTKEPLTVELDPSQSMKKLTRSYSYNVRLHEGGEARYYRLVLEKDRVCYLPLFATTRLRRRVGVAGASQDTQPTPLLMVTRRHLDEQESETKSKGLDNIPTDA